MTMVRGVSLQQLMIATESRGNLSVVEFPWHVPFVPKRFFMVYNVPETEVRGEHAHRRCKQFLVCAHGSVSVMVDNGMSRETITLNSPAVGLYMEPLIWSVQQSFSPGAVLIVLASEHYDPYDYIRDYALFRQTYSLHL